MVRLFEQSPQRFLRILLFAQLVLWTAIPAFTYAGAPLDVLENIGWGREWQLGYYKHPPLQAWVTYAAWLAGGGKVWAIYLLSQLVIVATQLGLFALAKDIVGPKRALWAVVLFSLAYYVNLPSPELNNNILQMPFWIWSAYALRRAIVKPGPVWWLALAALLALTLYTKYSVVVLVAVLALALLTQAKGRATLRTPWPWMGGVVALALVAPQLWWLRSVDFMPLTFIADQNKTPGLGGRLAGIGSFLGGQVLDLILVGAMLLILGAKRSAPGSAREDGFDERRFVAVLALGPYAITVLMSLFSDVALRDMWGAPMAALAVLGLVTFFDPTARPGRARLALPIWAALFLVLPAGAGVAVTFAGTRAKPPKIAFPAASIAHSLDQIWQDQTATPLDLVAGETWPSGVVAAYSVDRPSVFVDGNWRYSPWVTPQRVADRGVLVVWQQGDDPPAGLKALGPFQARGRVQARYRRGGKMATMNWAIRAPGMPAPVQQSSPPPAVKQR